jgi:predicted nucleic-acid-binding protein
MANSQSVYRVVGWAMPTTAENTVIIIWWAMPTLLNRETLIATLENLFNTNLFVFENREAISWSIQQMKIGNADFSDYLIARINQLSGCHETASFDVKLGQSEGIKLLD